jgi:transposase
MDGVFPLPAGKTLAVRQIQIDESDGRVKIEAQSVQPSGQCPLCGQESRAVHSRYWRRLRDLPWGGWQVELHLEVQKYFCKNPACHRRIFTERLPEVARPYGRQTTRLAQAITRLGLAVGGSMGRRISRFLGFPISIEVLLRAIRRLAVAKCQAVTVLGIDDWAMRKGMRYGTLLVDMVSGRPIELLPSRETEPVANWLRLHPEIEVVSRDRAGAYAEAARNAVPQALQVADGWHLLKNLRDALALAYERHRRLLSTLNVEPTLLQPAAAQRQDELAVLNQLAPAPPPTSQPLSRTRLMAQARAEHWHYWKGQLERVHQLRRQGLSIGAMVRETGLARRTVKKYLHLDTYPKRTAPRPGPRLIDPFRLYLQQRIQAGVLSHRQLWQELVSQGFTGSQTTVYRYITIYRQQLGIPAACLPRSVPRVTYEFTPRRLAALVLCRPEALSDHQRHLITQAGQLHSDIAQATQLAQDFAAMLRTHALDQLVPWIQRVQAASFASLNSFVAGIHRDYAAVCAALSTDFSNGRAEGHVNRLKFIKRQMFGRAKFDLLRLRVLLTDIPG